MPSVRPFAEIYLRINSVGLTVDVKQETDSGTSTIPFEPRHRRYETGIVQCVIGEIDTQLKALVEFTEAPQRRIGEELGSLLSGPLDTVLSALLPKVEACGSYLRLLLDVEHPDLRELPWEFAIWLQKGMWLAADPAFTFVRLVTRSGTTKPPATIRRDKTVAAYMLSSVDPGFNHLRVEIRNRLRQLTVHSNNTYVADEGHSSTYNETSIQSGCEVLYFFGHGSSQTITWRDSHQQDSDLDAFKFLSTVGFENRPFPFIVMMSCADTACAAFAQGKPKPGTFGRPLVESGAHAVLSIWGVLSANVAPALVSLIQLGMQHGYPVDRVLQFMRCYMQVVERNDCVWQVLPEYDESEEYKKYICPNWARLVLSAPEPRPLNFFADFGYTYGIPVEQKSTGGPWSQATTFLFQRRDTLDLLKSWLEDLGLPLVEEKRQAWLDSLFQLLAQFDMAAVEYLDFLARIRARCHAASTLAAAWHEFKWSFVAEIAARGVVPRDFSEFFAARC